ncbi:flagellar basal body-associated FliL family protein [Limimaricola litoreus]|uniref:Flagellar protein FliL n=1 Tax=Limimaricola litoreus TaxID=2955316 RepID=A0A9X2JMT3_9RHOB|nr:flagellar basal body-associated FliL family protein [Limimaricola litoreus]MCP1167667.1 flagellar basal body-associated FliL family protein [Limimaricola litoreus]
MTDATPNAIGAEGKARPGRLRLILLVLLSVLSLGGGLVAAVGPSRMMELVGLGGGAPEDVAAVPEEEAPGEVLRAALATDPARMAMPFEEIIVNITATTASGRQTSRFLKLDLALIYDSSQPEAERLEERRIYLRDSFQDYLRTLDERDLRGSLGLAELKSELLRRARAVAGSDIAHEILVSDMIVQ